ncbi:MFS general substrate transporter [Daedaleopsis nitida]|nr:MFS general substrate transporter [Daedaleopsis nitida]
MSVKEKADDLAVVAGDVLPSLDDRSEHSTLTVADERRLVRKQDWRVLPFVCAMYLLAELDRTTLGNARLQGLPEDILSGDPTGVQFDLATSAFYFSFVTLAIPAALLAKFCSPRIWFGCATVGWGVCAVLTATAFDFQSLMVSRVALGFFESGVSPMAAVYLSLFYTKGEIGLRIAAYQASSAIAGAFAGLLAFAIQNAHLSIPNWKLLFIIEGAPAVILGVLCFLFLPNRPEDTSIFNDKERKIAIERMNRGSRADVGKVLRKDHVLGALSDWRVSVYSGGLMYFAGNCASASISAFLPTIIETFGFTDALAQLLTVPPRVVATVMFLAFAYASDKLRVRSVFITASGCIGGIGYILLLTVPTNVHVRYFATFCITSATYGIFCNTLAWFAHNVGSESKRSTVLPLIQAVGHCGSVVGSHIYPLTQGPRYIQGFSINCAFDFMAAAIAVTLSLSFRADNRKKDRLYGKPEQDACVDTTELADKVRLTPVLSHSSDCG